MQKRVCFSGQDKKSKKNRPNIREPQRTCCTFAPLEIESGDLRPHEQEITGP